MSGLLSESFFYCFLRYRPRLRFTSPIIISAGLMETEDHASNGRRNHHHIWILNELIGFSEAMA